MIVPNLGVTDTVSWEDVLDLFQGTGDYIQMFSQKKVRVAVNRVIDQIPKVFTGSVRALATTDERGTDHYIDRLSLRPILDRTIKNLSGGELQRVAITACARDADFYFSMRSRHTRRLPAWPQTIRGRA